MFLDLLYWLIAINAIYTSLVMAIWEPKTTFSSFVVEVLDPVDLFNSFSKFNLFLRCVFIVAFIFTNLIILVLYWAYKGKK